MELEKFPYNRQVEIIRMVYDEYISPTISELIMELEEYVEEHDMDEDGYNEDIESNLRALERVRGWSFDDILKMDDMKFIYGLKNGFRDFY